MMGLTPAEVLYLHELALEYGGGSPGVRSLDLLESAVARALQTFDEQPLYRTPHEQAAACAHALARNHPFVDGNKRTAYLALGLWLRRAGYDLALPTGEAVATMNAVAAGEVGVEELAAWAKTWSKPV